MTVHPDDVEYAVERPDEDTIHITATYTVPVQTLDGSEGEREQTEVVGELPADWSAVGPIIGDLQTELAPSVPPGGKSVTQQMDEAYDR